MDSISRITGRMMKKVRIREKPTTNWFGTAPVMPNAFRASEKTIRIRGKQVVRMRSDGARLKIVSAPTMRTLKSRSSG